MKQVTLLIFLQGTQIETNKDTKNKVKENEDKSMDKSANGETETGKSHPYNTRSSSQVVPL